MAWYDEFAGTNLAEQIPFDASPQEAANLQLQRQQQQMIQEALSERTQRQKAAEMAKKAMSLRQMQKDAGVGYLYTPQGKRVNTDAEATRAIVDMIRQQGVGDSERLAGLTSLRDAEARMPSPVQGQDISQIPIDRQAAAAALAGQRNSDNAFLNPGWARHLSPVGRGGVPSMSADEARALAAQQLAPRLAEMKGGKYREGSFGNQGTRIEYGPRGEIIMRGANKETYNVGGSDLSRRAYEEKRNAGIKASRDAQRQRVVDARERMRQLASGALGGAANPNNDSAMLKASLVARTVLQNGGTMEQAVSASRSVYEQESANSRLKTSESMQMARDAAQNAFDLKKQSESFAAQGDLQKARLAAEKSQHEDDRAVQLSKLEADKEISKEEVGVRRDANDIEREKLRQQQESMNNPLNRAQRMFEATNGQGGTLPELVQQEREASGGGMPSSTKQLMPQLTGKDLDAAIGSLVEAYSKDQASFDSPEEQAAIREQARKAGISVGAMKKYIEANRRSTFKDAVRIFNPLRNPLDIINPLQVPRSLYNVYDRLANEPTDDMENFLRSISG